MKRTLAILSLLAIPAMAADLSLKGTWRADMGQASYCDKPAPAPVEHVSFEIQDAPYLNSAFSSFNLSDANVIGTVSVQLRLEHQRYPETIVSGLLVGEIVRNSQIGSGATGKAAGLTLQGYIVSREQFGAWVQNKKRGFEPANAGEVELAVSGNALQGYTLTGVLRSGEGCSNVSPLNSAVQYLEGHFGRGVPSKWSAQVTLKKQ
jgi:hypothetical protein